MAENQLTVFYDGHCGLCHGLVLFLIARDRTGEKFDFAPLQGEYCAKIFSHAERKRLPDSVVVRTDEGLLLVKSAAVVYLLKRLGGPWYAVGAALGILPTSLRDFGYDCVARMRHRLFSTPANTCPLVPFELPNRFRP